MNLSIDEYCCFVDIPQIVDERGCLSFIEFEKAAGFLVKRCYWIYNIPKGATRGGHAHKNLSQLLVALRGSLDIEIDNGKEKRILTLDDPRRGLVIKGVIWRDIRNFKDEPIMVAFVSDNYEESDYIRNYEDFLRYVS